MDKVKAVKEMTVEELKQELILGKKRYVYPKQYRKSKKHLEKYMENVKKLYEE